MTFMGLGEMCEADFADTCAACVDWERGNPSVRVEIVQKVRQIENARIMQVMFPKADVK
jgi:hypothetical protein